jgi:serine/threonine protein kinase
MTEYPLTGQEALLLPGVGGLGKQLEVTGESALYEAELEGSAGPVLVEIRPGGTPQAALQLNRWCNSLALVHPHLLKLYRAGESVLAGAPVICLVSERADESLAAVLQERPLSEQETREMLEPVLATLAYLHQSGFTHSGLNPANVRAAGETLKLSCGTLRRISADGDPAAGDPADDVYSVGVLVVQALTRKIPEIDEDSGPYILREASEPLIGIVRHCLEPDPARRWTADQALAHLSPPKVPPPLRLVPNTPGDTPVDTHPATNRKWIYAAAAALLLIVATLALTRKNDSPHPVVPAPQTAQAPVAPAPPPPQSEKEAVANTTPPPAPKPQNRKASGWAAIVASYGPRAAAEKRALALSKRWPKFHWEVFQPPSQTLNFVVIGKNLSEDKAEALREHARQAGISNDVYIQRFE